MQSYYIITFKNTHEAMMAENQAENNKIKVTVMPTPTYITKSCGISLKVEEENFEHINQLIDNEIISFKNIYFKEGNEHKIIK